MKTILIAIGLVLSLPDCCYHERPPAIVSRTDYVDGLIHETVALDMFVNDDGEAVDPDAKDAEMKAYCAGVWVDKNTFLTANHCVEDLRPEGQLPGPEEEMFKLLGIPVPGSPVGAKVYYSIRSDVAEKPFKKRVFHTGKVLAVNENTDLALVRDDGQAVPAHPSAQLASDVKTGEDLDIVGMPARTWWCYTHGWVANILPTAHAPNDKEMEMIQVQAPIWFGNSGGPAFNSAGQLVGISSMISTRVPDRAFYVHLDHVRDFLHANAIH